MLGQVPNPTDSQRAALRERIRRGALTRQVRHRGPDDVQRACARQVYAELEPRNPVARHRWLFVRHYVDESLDEYENGQLYWQERERRIAAQRRDALQEIWTTSGVRRNQGAVSIHRNL